MRSSDLRIEARRLALLQGAIALALLALAARAAQLALYDGRGAERARAQIERTLHLAPARGLIVDRQRQPLAVTVRAPSVYAVGRLPHPTRSARRLARVLGLPADTLAKRLARGAGYRFVARWVGEHQAEQVEALGLTGVGIVREPRRAYPYGALAGALLGFANIDGRGARGIEQAEDRWLRGEAERIEAERDARGRLLAAAAADPIAGRGGDVALAVDLALQADAERALAEAVAASGARGGLVLGLDPRHGDLLALAEQPGFDPNRFREFPYSATRARAFLDALEPGSALKPFLIAAALEAGAIEVGESLDLEGGTLRLPGGWIRDLHPHPSLDPAGILRVSSNVGAVRIAQRLGPEAHYRALRRFGFGSPTGCGFPDESAGVLRPWQSWRPLDQATIAFGQGIAVTAAQLAAATAALANRGWWRTPRLVLARRRPGGTWVPTPVPSARRVLSARAAEQVVRMMEGVVGPGGTGWRAALVGVRVAGKTGTAQQLDPGTGTYSDERYVAWFVGFAPAEAPELVLVVAIDEPQGPLHTGGAVAAPVFAKVMAAYLTRRGLPTRPRHAPEAAWTRARRARAQHPPRHEKPALRSPPLPVLVRLRGRILVPDLTGLTPGEVKRVTARTGLRLEIQGRGRVVEQEPPPGTVVGERGARLRLRLAAAPGRT